MSSCRAYNDPPLSSPGRAGWPWNESIKQLPENRFNGHHMPKISIITPSYQQAQFLEECIRSVILQNYPNLEYIIIDGESTDNSVDIIKRYEQFIKYWVSEPDKGQAHAINKGFRLATGQIIGWLNSDDLYAPCAFLKAVDVFSKHNEIDFIFSHCIRINEKDLIVSMKESKDPTIFNVLNYPNFIPQPTVFFRDTIFKETGYLNEKYFLAMDIDYWRRISKNHKMLLVNDVFAYFRLHENSKTSRYLKDFKKESLRSFLECGGSRLSPFFYETYIKPYLMSIFIFNPLSKKIFSYSK